MNIAFHTFEQWHRRNDIGSSRIRAHWVIKYWHEAELYRPAHKYDVEIFQKAYWLERIKETPALTILDVCDADWLDPKSNVMECARAADIITVPTPELARYFMCAVKTTPVFVVPDRIDFERLPKRKTHKGRANDVVWFGYSHNQRGQLEQTVSTLKHNDLQLHIISNEIDVNLPGLKVDFIPYDSERIHEDLQKYGDMALFPQHEGQPYDKKFKSNNKTDLCHALGIPVAKTGLDVRKFLHGTAREKYSEDVYQWVKTERDVRQSVKDYKTIIQNYGE